MFVPKKCQQIYSLADNCPHCLISDPENVMTVLRYSTLS